MVSMWCAAHVVRLLLLALVTTTTTMTTALPAQDPPTSVVAIAGDGQASISWTAPSSSSPSNGTISYTVYASPGGMTQSIGGSATSLTFTGLTNRVAYTFTVTATSELGTSVASQPSKTIVPRTVITWSPIAIGVWSDVTKWSPQQLPTADDIVHIYAGYVEIDCGAVVVDTLRVTDYGRLDIRDNVTITIVHELKATYGRISGPTGTTGGGSMIVMNASLDTLGIITDVTIVQGYIPRTVPVIITPPVENAWSTIINGSIDGNWTIRGITYYQSGYLGTLDASGRGAITMDHLIALPQASFMPIDAIQLMITQSMIAPHVVISVHGGLAVPSSSDVRLGRISIESAQASLTIIDAEATARPTPPSSVTIHTLIAHSSRLILCNGCDVMIINTTEFSGTITTPSSDVDGAPGRVLFGDGCVIKGLYVTLSNGAQFGVSSGHTVTWSTDFLNTIGFTSSEPSNVGMVINGSLIVHAKENIIWRTHVIFQGDWFIITNSVANKYWLIENQGAFTIACGRVNVDASSGIKVSTAKGSASDVSQLWVLADVTSMIVDGSLILGDTIESISVENYIHLQRSIEVATLMTAYPGGVITLDRDHGGHGVNIIITKQVTLTYITLFGCNNATTNDGGDIGSVCGMTLADGVTMYYGRGNGALKNAFQIVVPSDATVTWLAKTDVDTIASSMPSFPSVVIDGSVIMRSLNEGYLQWRFITMLFQGHWLNLTRLDGDSRYDNNMYIDSGATWLIASATGGTLYVDNHSALRVARQSVSDTGPVMQLIITSSTRVVIDGILGVSNRYDGQPFVLFNSSSPYVPMISSVRMFGGTIMIARSASIVVSNVIEINGVISGDRSNDGNGAQILLGDGIQWLTSTITMMMGVQFVVPSTHTVAINTPTTITPYAAMPSIRVDGTLICSGQSNHITLGNVIMSDPFSTMNASVLVTMNNWNISGTVNLFDTATVSIMGASFINGPSQSVIRFIIDTTKEGAHVVVVARPMIIHATGGSMITGTGSISGDVHVSGSSRLTIGSTSSISITGRLYQSSEAILVLESQPSTMPLLTVGGSASLCGAVQLLDPEPSPQQWEVGSSLIAIASRDENATICAFSNVITSINNNVSVSLNETTHEVIVTHVTGISYITTPCDCRIPSSSSSSSSSSSGESSSLSSSTGSGESSSSASSTGSSISSTGGVDSSTGSSSSSTGSSSNGKGASSVTPVVLGCVTGVLAIGIGIYCWRRRRGGRQSATSTNSYYSSINDA